MDLLLTTFFVNPNDFSGFSTPVLTLLLLLTLIILVLTFIIWKIILTVEFKEKARHKNVLLIAALATLIAGLSSILVYLLEIILSSGFLGTAYLTIDFTSLRDETGIVFYLMVLTYLLKYSYNTFAIIGCLLIGIVWTQQFRIWARFSKANFIKSFYFVGVILIILFLDQIGTTTLQYILYWAYPESNTLPIEVRIVISILLVMAILALGIYIYFLTVAGEHLRIPHETEELASRKIFILPFIFFFLWFLANLGNVGGDTGAKDPIITSFGNFLLMAVFIPISIAFIRHARKIESIYLKKNLYQAAIGTLALSTFSIVGPNRWTGMAVLIGYSLAFSVLTWSIANLSQFIGSREALIRRLKQAGDQFLSEIGEAELKDKSIQQMTKVMSDVSKGYIEDLAKIEVRTPPTEDEIRRYIVRTMGVEASPSEAQVLSYLKDAMALIKEDNVIQ